MPYSLNWYIKNEILYARYWGVTTADELRECLLKIREMIDSSPRHLVHIISDVGDIEQSVRLSDSLRVVREVGAHPRSGWSISIREKSPLVKIGAAFGTGVFKLRFRAFTTLDQALEHLKLYDEDLSWDQVDNSIGQSLKSG